MLVFRAGSDKMPVKIANREDPENNLGLRCLGLFGRQLVFEILEHLPYTFVHLTIH